jgi:Zn-dependent membrane protease YugP
MSNTWGIYFVFLIPPLIVGFVIQHRLKTTVGQWMQVAASSGMTGEQVARAILDHNGLANVPVQPAPGGPLSDHYDPRNRTVNLSQGVYDGRAVASVAIAAHEVGHALQHQKAYAPFKIRSSMAPAVGIASQAWFFLLLIGIFANLAGLATFAIILFALVVLFQLVTLPVEFDASRRAKKQLSALGLVSGNEAQGASKVLSAAALTYVAAALVAVTQLVYLLMSRN